MKPNLPRKGHKKKRKPDWLGKKKDRRRHAIEHPPDTTGYDWVGYFDGSCTPTNPGGTCSIGILLLDKYGEVVAELSKEIGGGIGWSNNVSEHSAAYHLFDAIAKYAKPGDKALVMGDSNMTVQQLNGAWKAKGGMYLPFFRQAKEALRLVRSSGVEIEVRWIPRELNSLADELSKGISR